MEMLRTRRLMAAVCALVVGLCAAGQGRVIYADDDATEVGDGSSWVDAFQNLQDAFAMATDGDEIRVAQGTYKPDQGTVVTPGDQTATFSLVNLVILKGGYAGFGEPNPDVRDIVNNVTILSGDLDAMEEKLFSAVWYREVDETVAVMPNRAPSPEFHYR